MSKEVIEKRIDETSKLIGKDLFNGNQIFHLANLAGGECEQKIQAIKNSILYSFEIEAFEKHIERRRKLIKEGKDLFNGAGFEIELNKLEELKNGLEHYNNTIKNSNVKCIVKNDVDYLLNYFAERYSTDEKNEEIEKLLRFLSLHENLFNEVLIERFINYYSTLSGHLKELYK